MALIMCLETATKNCSVAINKDGSLLAYKEEVSENYSHSEQLIPFIQSVLIDQQLELSDLDAIAVSKGPGSYTGLRIGIYRKRVVLFFRNPSIGSFYSRSNGKRDGQENSWKSLLPNDRCTKNGSLCGLV